MLPLTLLTAVASAVNPNAPPAPNLSRFPLKPWMGFLILFVLVAAVLAISLMPSKRSHQD